MFYGCAKWKQIVLFALILCNLSVYRFEALKETKRWADTLRKNLWKFGSCGEDIIVVISDLDRRVGH